MSISDHFSLPYIGMKDGFHRYSFVADKTFFDKFENSPIVDGLFDVIVEVDKRSGLSDLAFFIEGHTATTCDRCLADIRLPAKSKYDLHVKVSNSGIDDDEVIFIKEDQSQLPLDQIIYEFICLSLPLIHIYDCEKDDKVPCNIEILKKLKNTSELPEEENKENIWESLSGLQPDNE